MSVHRQRTVRICHVIESPLVTNSRADTEEQIEPFLFGDPQELQERDLEELSHRLAVAGVAVVNAAAFLAALNPGLNRADEDQIRLREKRSQKCRASLDGRIG